MEPGRAVVGGVSYVVGGWGEYEADRRRELWEASRVSPASRYPGRTYIHGGDAVESLVSARAPRALRKAAMRLAKALGAEEDRLCDVSDDGLWECGSGKNPQILNVPRVTSADLREFAATASMQNDPWTIRKIGNAVVAHAAGAGKILEPLPADAVTDEGLLAEAAELTDDEAVLRLEAAVAPHVKKIEGLQAAAATLFDEAASFLTKTGGAAHSVTRGEEVDAAAAAPPPNAKLPWDQGAYPFDLDEEGNAVASPAHAGIFYGLSNRDDPARATLLTPTNIAAAALMTSGRVYAWYIFDSPEGRFGIRAAPRSQATVCLDADAIVAWLRPRLHGNPPHKIATKEYVAYLRGLGLDIKATIQAEETRFDLTDATTLAEREHMLKALRALTPADLVEFNWSDYDRSVKACKVAVELGGDVTVDLEKKAIYAPKVRAGTLWGTHVHQRSYVTFHTHPAARFLGAIAEPPSVSDILNTLAGCALGSQAWAFVSAPEGTYIMRPTKTLVDAYLRDPRQTSASVAAAYSERIGNCEGSVVACGHAAVRGLEEAGFIAGLRSVACMPLREGPDLYPTWNRRSRKETLAAYTLAAAMTPEELAATDWDPVVAEGETPIIREATWSTASVVAGRAAPSGDGHMFQGADKFESFPEGFPGPLFIVYYPVDDEFPTQLPHAAIRAATQNAANWAWLVFLSPARITVFRAGAGGVEVHGPVARSAKPAKK